MKKRTEQEHLSLFSACPKKLNTAGTACVDNCDSQDDNLDKDNDGQCDKCPIKLDINGDFCVSFCYIPDADNDGQCGCPNEKFVNSNGTSCVENCDGEFVSAIGKHCRTDCSVENNLIHQADYDNDKRCGCSRGLSKKLSYDATQCVLCNQRSPSASCIAKDLFDFDEDGQCGCQSESVGKFVNTDHTGCVKSCGENEEVKNGKCNNGRKNVLD